MPSGQQSAWGATPTGACSKCGRSIDDHEGLLQGDLKCPVRR